MEEPEIQQDPLTDSKDIQIKGISPQDSERRSRVVGTGTGPLSPVEGREEQGGGNQVLLE